MEIVERLSLEEGLLQRFPGHVDFSFAETCIDRAIWHITENPVRN